MLSIVSIKDYTDDGCSYNRNNINKGFKMYNYNLLKAGVITLENNKQWLIANRVLLYCERKACKQWIAEQLQLRLLGLA